MKKKFTLIELLIVVAFIGIIGTVAFGIVAGTGQDHSNHEEVNPVGEDHHGHNH